MQCIHVSSFTLANFWLTNPIKHCHTKYLILCSSVSLTTKTIRCELKAPPLLLNFLQTHHNQDSPLSLKLKNLSLKLYNQIICTKRIGNEIAKRQMSSIDICMAGPHCHSSNPPTTSPTQIVDQNIFTKT